MISISSNRAGRFIISRVNLILLLIPITLKDVFISSLTLILSTNNAIEPEQYSINNIYPNPFNPSTTISFSLPIRSQVELSVYNILGNKIATLENEIFERGLHHIIWNGKDNNGVNVGSGVYFCKMKSENFQQVKKLTILK